MLWGPTAFEVPHRPSRIGQSGWNESLPAGNMQVKSSARVFPRAHPKSHGSAICLSLDCHAGNNSGSSEVIQRGGCVMPTKWQGPVCSKCSGPRNFHETFTCPRNFYETLSTKLPRHAELQS